MRPLLPLPREHGAWVILVVPYLTGAAVGLSSADGSPVRVLIGLPAVLLLFISRPAAMTLVKRRYMDGSFGQNAASLATGSFLAAGTAFAILVALALTSGLWGLLPLALIGCALFSFHLWRILVRRERSVSGELAGILMLTLTAPLACYLAASSLNDDCWSLWLLSALYFGASVFYVKMKLRPTARKDGPFSAHAKLRAGGPTMAYLVFMLAALMFAFLAGAIPTAVPLAYVPVALYMPLSVLTLKPSANIKLEGIVQTVIAVLFGLVLVAAYLV